MDLAKAGRPLALSQTYKFRSAYYELLCEEEKKPDDRLLTPLLAPQTAGSSCLGQRIYYYCVYNVGKEGAKGSSLKRCDINLYIS